MLSDTTIESVGYPAPFQTPGLKQVKRKVSSAGELKG